MPHKNRGARLLNPAALATVPMALVVIYFIGWVAPPPFSLVSGSLQVLAVWPLVFACLAVLAFRVRKNLVAPADRNMANLGVVVGVGASIASAMCLCLLLALLGELPFGLALALP